MSLSSTMRRFAAISILVMCFGFAGTALAFGRSSQGARCRYSNIGGEQIRPVNDFRVQGISCTYALLSAAGYTTSPASINVTVPGTEVFQAIFGKLQYRWVCRTTELPAPELHHIDGITVGTYFHCRANQEVAGKRLRAVSMSFKSWVQSGETRLCPELSIAEEAGGWLLREYAVSRNLACSEANQWIAAAASSLLTAMPYTAVEVDPPYLRHYYHYRDSSGAPYDCDEDNNKDQNGVPVRFWRCFSASGGVLGENGVPEFPEGWQSKEYVWVLYPQ
jgi:hypothetical protein